ncbi:MAG: N-6 DNA methylase [Chitinophagaceae bacterium]|nr:N-6 DNA methylase [Chitinophagaceae bacterium]MCW5906177.1 N-6 DNA methylase [Chitinophagaceae bacterium]
MISKEEAYQKIKVLVERFDSQKESYTKAAYNETQTRRDFIDPFWNALGWDIHNEKGCAESYREVIHEDKIKIGGATKAPDYSFRLSGGKRLFFLEAKKPSVFIKDEMAPAYQVRRYGWSAKMAISVISDFEELAIYDCTNKPKQTDKASNGRIKYLTYKEYLAEFDFIWNTFSKEKILQGGFDKFISSDKNKKGTSTVDNEFLLSLDKWRVDLASNIALRNKSLTEEELNFIVQHIIDRIIFLRIAEDRGVEPYGNLQSDIKIGNFYNNLLLHFHQADQKYNSGLFDFKKDTISNKIQIDNKVIKEIIAALYYPICPYEFSVLSVEILGSAYEQFLGKQISLTAGGRARIEEKPAIRKAGGVYYTPQYIVDYIVKNTVGKLINNKIPKEVSAIKIADPSCGSGSFLLGAYQYLLDWHKDYYTTQQAVNKKIISTKDNPLTPLGELTTTEKKRILLNNIYGVDLDANAVEVTKLSLLLKCMEGETKESIEAQTTLFHERILPSLENNIKCGNSLIDIDYYDNEINFGEERKIKPFSWQNAFPEIFNRHVAEDKSWVFRKQYEKVKKLHYETEELIKQLTAEEPNAPFNEKNNGGFDCIIGNPPYVQPIILDKASQLYLAKKYSSNTDLYSMFIERGIDLLRSENYLGFIVPSLFLKGVKYKNLRNTINTSCNNVEIIEKGDKVFGKVKMPTCIILLTKGANYSGNDFFSNENSNLFKKVKTIQLGKISATKRGLEIGKDKLIDKGKIKCLAGSNLDTFSIKSISYIDKEVFNLFSKSKDIFKSPKLMIRETGNKFFATIDYDNLITTRSIYNTRMIDEKYSPELILGIINSSLFKFYFKQFIAPKTNIFPKIRIAQLKELPIPYQINIEHKKEIVQLVDQLLVLNKELQTATLPIQQEQIQSIITYAEDKLDTLIYQLYNLTKEEIKLVEEG